MTPAAAYAIVTSPRSGSTLLCRLLRETGCAGRPESYFHQPSVEAWREGVDAPRAATAHDQLRAILSAAIERGRGRGNVFGLRLQRHSFAFFIEQMRNLFPTGSEAALFDQAFGPTRFVHLTREDKLAQAVSYIRAEQSGLWHRHVDGSEIERLAPPREPDYDAERIAAQLAEFERSEAEWQDWFVAQSITPLRLTYGALSANPKGTVAQVLEFLGQDPAQALRPEPDTARLADAVNAEWIARFRAGA